MGEAPKARPVLKTFGTLRLEAGGVPLGGPVAQRHRLALLAILAAADGKQVTRDRLLAMLWPESDDHQARTLLNTAVHTIRRELGPDVIQSVGDALYLNGDLLEADVVRFREGLQAGRPDLAVPWYVGPFLDGFHLAESTEFNEWVDEARQRLAARQAEALEQLAREAMARGEPAAAIRHWRALSQHLPYSQRAVSGLLAALEQSGEQAEAIEAGERYLVRLRRNLGVEPEPEVVSLLARLRSARVVAAPPSSTAVPLTAKPPLEAAAESPARPFTPLLRRRRRWPLVASFAAIGLLGLSLAWPKSGGGSQLDASLLVVVPFQYAGPPELAYLGEGVVDLLAARLEPGDGARVLRPRPLLVEWGRRQFASQGERQRAALDAARQAGAGSVLLGSLTVTAGQFLLSGTLVDVGSGREGRRLRGVSGPADSLLVLVDQLTTEVLIRQVPGTVERDLGLLAGRPLPAVHQYLRGEAAYRRGLWDDAANHFQHALELDTTFAHAALGLLKAESFGRNTPRWQWAMNIVKAHERQLGRAEFVMYDAFIGRPLLRRQDDWSEYVVLMPDQPEGWYALGDLEYHWGSLLGFTDPHQRALANFYRAIALDSLFAPALHHVVELLAGRRMVDSLRPWARRHFASADSAERTTTALGWLVAGALGDSVWLREARARFANFTPGELRQVVRLSQVYGLPPEDARIAVALFKERAATPRDLRLALEEEWVLESNLGHPRRADSILGLMSSRFPADLTVPDLAILSHLYGEGTRARAEAAVAILRPRVRGGTDRDRWTALCGVHWWDAKHGRRDGLLQVADVLMEPVLRPWWEGREFGSDNEICARTLRAIAVSGSSPTDTTGALRALDAYLAQSALSRMRLESATLEAAALFATEGDHTRALTAIRRRGVMQQAPFLLATQLLRHARLAAKAGQRDEAAAAYRLYLALRRVPEPGPLADTTRSVADELAALLARD
jgi:DNA-binding SARP family transcriptional activator